MENNENPLPTQATSQEPTEPIKPILKKIKGEYFLLGGALMLLAVLLFIGKSFLVAATVNGSPISRWSVVKDLEKQSGKAALESIIQKKLLDAQLAKEGVTVSQAEVDAEIKMIEQQVSAEGGTLKAALQAQGVTEESLREQIAIQKKLEKVLADKVTVSDADLEAYKKQNDVKLPEGQKEADFNAELKQQLKRQKFQEVAQAWVADLTKNAKINYYVNY
jgi:parvulin-like peptidyl-prolyl isomerase